LHGGVVRRRAACDRPTSNALRTRDGESDPAARARAELSSSPVYLFESA
jgi:hypothetical protein